MENREINSCLYRLNVFRWFRIKEYSTSKAVYKMLKVNIYYLQIIFNLLRVNIDVSSIQKKIINKSNSDIPRTPDPLVKVNST